MLCLLIKYCKLITNIIVIINKHVVRALKAFLFLSSFAFELHNIPSHLTSSPLFL